MDINISVTRAEMDEMGFDKDELESHVTEALDSCVKELPGYYVNVDID